MIFTHDDNDLPIRTVSINPQILVPHSLKHCVLILSSYTVTAAYCRGRKIFYRIKRHFYWPDLILDCYAKVQNCAECAKNRINLRCNIGPITLYVGTESLDSVNIYILSEIIRTPRVHRYILAIMNHFTKMVKAIPME